MTLNLSPLLQFVWFSFYYTRPYLYWISCECVHDPIQLKFAYFHALVIFFFSINLNLKFLIDSIKYNEIIWSKNYVKSTKCLISGFFVPKKTSKGKVIFSKVSSGNYRHFIIVLLLNDIKSITHPYKEMHPLPYSMKKCSLFIFHVIFRQIFFIRISIPSILFTRKLWTTY